MEKHEKDSEISQNEGVLKKSIHGGKWMTIGYIFQKFLGFFSFLILARILSPADFGVMAIVLLVPKLLQSVTETGLSTAVIQKEGHIEKYLNPIWSIGVSKSIVIVIIMIVGGSYIAQFLNVPQAATAVRLGGFFILLQNFSNIAEIYFFKDIDMKKIFIRNVVREVSYIVVAIISVFFFKSYWTLMFATFVAYSSQTISTYFLHPYRPKLTLNWTSLKELFGYSKWIVGREWLNQGYGAAESAIVSKLTGVDNMGIFSKGKNIAAIVPGFLSSIITNISFPAYARIKDSKEKICDALLKSFDILFFISIPAIFLLILAGNRLVLIFLGSPWLAMVNVMRIFIIFFVINNIMEIGLTLFEAMGVPGKSLKFDMLRLPLTILLVAVFTTMYGIEGAALAIFIGSAPAMALIPYHIKKLTGLTYTALFQTTLVPFLLCLLLATPVLIWKTYFLHMSNLLFLSAISMIGLIYAAVTYIIGKKLHYGPYTTLQVVLKNVL